MAKTKGVFTLEEQAKIEEILSTYEKGLPKATAHQRILLKLISGEKFKERLWKYARPLIVKGAPALIFDLKSDICRGDNGKAQIMENMLLANLESMEKQMTLVGEDQEQDPTVQLWLMYFIA